MPNCEDDTFDTSQSSLPPNGRYSIFPTNTEDGITGIEDDETATVRNSKYYPSSSYRSSADGGSTNTEIVPRNFRFDDDPQNLTVTTTFPQATNHLASVATKYYNAGFKEGYMLATQASTTNQPPATTNPSALGKVTRFLTENPLGQAATASVAGAICSAANSYLFTPLT